MDSWENLRRQIRQEQEQSKLYQIWGDRVPEYRELSSQPLPAELELRWGWLCRAKLRSLAFEYDPREGLVGRLKRPEPRDPAEAEVARRWCEENFPRGGGQTGHCEPFYDELFALGIDGLRQRIERLEPTPARRSFLPALEGLTLLIEAAARAAEAGGNAELAADCRAVAHRPPESFRQALNLMLLVMLGIQFGDNAALVGPGRLDRRLWRFYERDCAAGKLTRDEARELLGCLYLQINDSCHRGLAFAVMAGGDDTVNELSYLSFEALRISRLIYPGVGLCVNERTPDDLLLLAVDLVAEGSPCPAFFNDRVIRRGLERCGVPPEESANYINSTCVEITPCGASNVWVASPYYNLSEALLQAMAEDPADFAALEEGLRRQLAERIREGVAVENANRQFRQQHTRRPLQSVFTRDCIERGRDLEDGGARYNWVECSFVGLANCVDALYVIREEVYRRHERTLAELRELLAADFAGHPELQQKFLNAYPKYGTGDPRVDSLIPPLLDFLKQECARYAMLPDGSPYLPGTFCWEMHQRLGSVTGATADGRRAGFPFADGAGPAQGREKAGPTAAVRSVTSWDHSALIGGSAFNMRYPKRLLATPENRRKLAALIRVFIERGGFQTQINVADRETLRRAQEHPEEYNDLVVRIGGYTDYFTRLSPGMQQELLLRTDYESL